MNDLEMVTAFLESHSTLTLATISDQRVPHAAPLFYLLHEGLQLYWVSSPSSMHSLNLANSVDVSVAVYSATDRWKEIRGVQMQGKVQLVTNPRERKAVLRAYVDRFHLGTIFRLAISGSNLYKFMPFWIRYLDNSKRFGFKREIVLPREERDPN